MKTGKSFTKKRNEVFLYFEKICEIRRKNIY